MARSHGGWLEPLQGSPALRILQRRLRCQKPMRAVQDSTNDVTTCVLDGCALRLSQGAEHDPGPAPQPADVLVLALLTANHCRAAGRRLWGKGPQQVAECSARALPQYRLWQALCQCRRIESRALVRDAALLRALGRMARDFEASIAPARLGSLAQRPRKLRLRVETFLARRSTGQTRFRAHVKGVLGAYLSAADIRRLLGRVKLARLRTVPESTLEEMAKHFGCWDWVIRYVEDPAFRNGVPFAVHEQFRECRARLVRLVRAGWHQSVGSCDAEDAVDEVLANRVAEYTYEGSLSAWLRTAALNLLRDAAARQSTSLEPPMAIVGPEPLPTEWLECLLQWALRFQLVLATFRPRGRPLAQAIWQAILAQARTGQRPSNPQLAAWVAARLRVGVTPLGIAQYRRRLRQRLAVLHYVLDLAPCGQPDLAGDASVLEYVDLRYGVDKSDVPTLRYLAAMARVARRDRTLAWTTLAALLVDRKVPLAEAQQIVSPLAGEAFTKAWPASQERLIRLLDPRPRRRGRGTLKRAKLGFFLTALLRLVLVEEAGDATLLQTLQPAGGEAEILLRAAQQLRRFFAVREKP